MNSEDSEIHFLVDEELVELEAILKDIDFRLKNPDYEKNQMILNCFVKACMKTLSKPKHIPVPTPSIQVAKQRLPIKPRQITIKEIKRVPISKDIYPIPAPGAKKLSHLKPVQKYKREIVRIKLQPNQIPLIQDNITNKPLSIADVNERYIVREPAIKKKEIRVLRNIIREKPRTPKEAWRLIKQAAPGLKEEQKTNIKYYAINALFALGRLEPLFHDPKITDIVCEGVGNYLTIKRDNKTLKTNIIFKDKEDLDMFLQKLARKLNRTLDENTPMIDTAHRNYRFHITLGLHGASSRFTIKKIE